MGMTENQNRVHAGIPTGGQYAATAHSDDVASLDGRPTATHTVELTGSVVLHNHEHPALPEWPANLPAPEVSFGFEDGQSLTRVAIDGKEKSFWSAAGMDGVLSGDDIGDPNRWEDFDWDDQEAAMAYAVAVHRRIDSAAVSIMTQASFAPATSEAIIAHALDRAPKM